MLHWVAFILNIIYIFLYFCGLMTTCSLSWVQGSRPLPPALGAIRLPINLLISWPHVYSHVVPSLKVMIWSLFECFRQICEQISAVMSFPKVDAYSLGAAMGSLHSHYHIHIMYIPIYLRGLGWRTSLHQYFALSAHFLSWAWSSIRLLLLASNLYPWVVNQFAWLTTCLLLCWAIFGSVDSELVWMLPADLWSDPVHLLLQPWVCLIAPLCILRAGQ